MNKNHLRIEYFTGQQEIVKALQISIKSTLRRNETLPHLLFCGTSKTGWLAKSVAYELGSKLWNVCASELSKESLANMLTSINEGDVVLIKDIEDMTQPITEQLYTAAKEFMIEITIGQGKHTRKVRIDLPHFTVIATTSHLDSVSAVFRDSFEVYKFEGEK